MHCVLHVSCLETQFVLCDHSLENNIHTVCFRRKLELEFCVLKVHNTS